MLPLNDDYYFKIQGVASGGSTPSGTLSITSNGTYDVSSYANANVDVEIGITPSGTINITENGTHDVTNYASANVNIEASGGATVETLGATPIPNDGTFVESVMFNTSLSDDEVKSILDGLTYTFNEMAGVEVYIIYNSASGTGSLLGVLKPADGMYCLLDYSSFTVFWHNVPDMAEDLGAMGWQEFTNPYPTNDNAMSGEFYGSPIGIENDKLTNLVYISGEAKSKTLSGTYDGSSIDVIENGVVDVETLIDEGKIPLKINVNVASSGEDMLQARVDNSLNAGRPSCRYLFYKSTIRNVDFLINLDISRVQEMSNMFEGCPFLTTIPQLDTSKVTNMNSMFKDCQVLTIIPQLDTSQVTDMGSMFNYCSSLTTIPQLDTSKVTTMSGMFNNCKNLTSIPQLDTSKATNMSNIFSSCSKLTIIPQLDTSKVIVMSSMFNYCSSLTTIPLLDMRSATSVGSMFNNCTNLTNLTLKNIKVNLQIGSRTSYGHLLTLESLLNTCQECINMNESLTLTMGSANLEKLASVYVKLTNAPEEDATLPKLPMVQCESSDEGAMTIQDYMAMKNWTLA